VSTTESLTVPDPQELRQHAQACLERANTSDNSNDQLLFLSMAGAWHALAGQVENIKALADQAKNDTTDKTDTPEATKVEA
jgi:hypothetical protein